MVKPSLSQPIKLMAICLLCALLANAQQAENRLLKKWRVAPDQPVPLEISNLRVNGNPINFDQPFPADNEWVKGLSLDVRNISGKVITHFEIGLHLPSPVPQTPSGHVTMVSYGAPTRLPDVSPTIRMQPGDLVHANYSDKSYESFKSMSSHIGLSVPVEITMEIESVVFDDDTMWSNGYLHHRSRSNPMAWNVIGRESEETKPSKAPVFSLPLEDMAGLKLQFKRLNRPFPINDPAAPSDATVTVVQQPDCPLLLSLTDIRARNPLKPQINFSVENKGANVIRAFSIRYEDLWEKEGRSGLVFNSVFSPRLPLASGQWQGIAFSSPDLVKPVKQITLSVDFVEFEDGRIWGDDSFHSADRLAGRRAGIAAEKELLLKMLATGGIQVLIRECEKSDYQAVVPPNHSPEWGESFRQSAKMVRSLIKYTNENSGPAAAVSTLQQPIKDSIY